MDIRLTPNAETEVAFLQLVTLTVRQVKGVPFIFLLHKIENVNLLLGFHL